MLPLHIISRSARHLSSSLPGFYCRGRFASIRVLRFFSSTGSNNAIVLPKAEKTVLNEQEMLALGNGSTDGDDESDADSDTDSDTKSDTDSDGGDYLDGVKKPWQALLENPSRAKWRTACEHPPEHLFVAVETILNDGGRSRKQMRKIHERISGLHDSLASKRERERRRSVRGNRLRQDSLAYKAELHVDAAVGPVPYTPDYTFASLHQRLMPNYAIAKRVMDETKSLLGANNFQPKRVIDFGIGCGGASAAALDAFTSVEWIHGIEPSQSMRDCAKTLVEDIIKQRKNPPRLTLSESLTADSSTGGSFDLAICAFTATELPHVASTLAAAAALWEKLKPNGIFIMIEPGTPDGFNSIKSVRTMLLDCCPPVVEFKDEMEGIDQCHIIAPCTHNGECPMERHKMLPRKRREKDEESDIESNADAQDRQDQDDNREDSWETLQSGKDDDVLEKIHLQETGVFESSFCSFVHNIPGGGSKKGEKISYLVAQKRILGYDEDPKLNMLHSSFSDVDIVDVLKETYQTGRAVWSRHKQERVPAEKERHLALLGRARGIEKRIRESKDDVHLGLEFLRGDERRSSFGRIIRAPIKRKGHIMLDYCSVNRGSVDGNGRIIRHVISKGFSNRVVPGQYQAARKARWGGFWPDVSSATIDLENKENNDTK